MTTTPRKNTNPRYVRPECECGYEGPWIEYGPGGAMEARYIAQLDLDKHHRTNCELLQEVGGVAGYSFARKK